ncbi:MAG: mechanosensitive ion channel family protein [Clostridia bacterium]|nr:mechanosensitive ion channel family protein [Clostridia bacterium]
MQQIVDKITSFLENTGLNILMAVVVLFLGLLIIKTVSRVSKSSLQRTAVEGATASFIVSIINFTLKLVLLFLVISLLFPNASTGLIAVLGTAGLAIGLALQGSLSNFANGMIIIFTKPFKEGDYVEIGSIAGSIRSIGILTTELLTPDNKKIVLNNTKVINSDITNYSARPTRRLDMTFAVACGSDMQKVASLLKEVAASHPNILDTPAHIIRMLKQENCAVTFAFRVWVPTSMYWDIYFDITEKVYFTFELNGIKPALNRMVLINGQEGENAQ